MTNITTFVEGMIGQPPVYFDWLPFVISGVLMLSLMEFLFDMFRGFGKWFR